MSTFIYRGKSARAVALRQRVYDASGNRCVYCSRQFVSGGPGYPPTPSIDHDVPTARGGADTEENLVAACKPCNSQKGRRTGEEYRAWRQERGL